MIAEAVPDTEPVEVRRTPYTVSDLAHNAYRESLKASRLEAAGMSRIAPPAEKVLAIVSITKELIRELGLNPEPVTIAQTTEPITPEQWRAAMKSGELKVIPTGKPEISYLIPPEVMAALIDAATRVAMGTDTRDMGIMGMEVSQPPRPWGDGADPTSPSVEDVMAAAEEPYA